MEELKILLESVMNEELLKIVVSGPRTRECAWLNGYIKNTSLL